jgi:hypothetical protein
MKPIGFIEWPVDQRAACARYLTFATNVIDALGIEFPRARIDPRLVARRHVEGPLLEVDRHVTSATRDEV